MDRVNFKNINTKSVDQSYFKPKVNVKVKKEVVEKPVEDKSILTKNSYKQWLDYNFYKDYHAIKNKAEVKLVEEIYQQIRRRTKYTPITVPKEMKTTEDFTWEIKANNNIDLGENINNLEVISKVEKPKDEITKELISNNKRSYQDRGYHGWHGHFKYTLNDCKIKISDNVGGCSVQQLYDWGGNSNNSNIPELLKHVLNDLNYGVGIVLCQVGSNYYKSLFCKTLEELGFKYYEEYKNHQHGGTDTGRIYSLIINKNEENKRVTTEK